MANSDALSTLVSWLSREVIAPHIYKKLFGGYEVRLYPVLFGSEWIFAKGALFGRARSDRLEIFAKMFSTPGGERGFCEWMYQNAKDRLEKYGKEPDTFRDFWVKTEIPELGAIPFHDKNAVKRLAQETCRLGEITVKAISWVLAGIGFGAKYPELTEKLWRQTYETTADPESWALARRAGVDIPEKDESLPLEETEHAVLLTVAYFVGQYFPELVEPLGLVEELEEGRREMESQ
jgi:hypothetical protein